MIVADTGAILALLDKADHHHHAMRALYDENPQAWLLPWAILPEVDYLVASEIGAKAERVWLDDLASGAFAVEWGKEADLVEARAIEARHEALAMGVVDAVVMAIAQRLRADIATVDLRHFGAVRLTHAPRLLPRDRGVSRPGSRSR